MHFYAFNVFEATVILQCLIFFACGKFYQIEYGAKSVFWEFDF